MKMKQAKNEIQNQNLNAIECHKVIVIMNNILIKLLIDFIHLDNEKVFQNKKFF